MNKKALWMTVIFVCAVAGLTAVMAVGLPALINTSGTYDTTMDITLTPSTIAWGEVTINTPVTKAVEISNTGGTNIDSLDFTVINLVGLSVSDFTFSCDIQGQSLIVGQTKIATFTFTLTSPVSSAWSFDIQVDE